MSATHQVSSVELTRDCDAVQIPSGIASILPKGTPVDITQSLGGTYTVHTKGGLYRISTRDADALGIAGIAPAETSAATPAGTPSELTEDQIWQVLKTCYDPEIPVNIVDLGLVYSLTIDPLPSGNKRVNVQMTLTAPGCGMGATIAGDAQQKLLALEPVEEARVDIVWEPVWNHGLITAEGRRILGLD